MKSRADVPRHDQEYIRRMFDSLAPRYETFTKLIGLGQDDRLRRQALEAVRPGARVLDLACGTGQMSFLAAEAAGPEGFVLGLDLSERMIARAQARQRRLGIPESRLRFVVGRGEDLPVEDMRFDAVLSAYALRNLYERITDVLAGLRRSLVPGGELAILDLTEPAHPVLRALYRVYFFGMVGLYGKALFGREYPTAYLPQSAERFFKAHQFIPVLERAGFADVRRRSFFLGGATLYRARG